MQTEINTYDQLTDGQREMLWSLWELHERADEAWLRACFALNVRDMRSSPAFRERSEALHKQMQKSWPKNMRGELLTPWDLSRLK